MILVEDDDGRRERRARAEVEERLLVAESRVRDLPGRLRVVHDDRATVPRREVERRKPRRNLLHRLDPGRIPLGEDRHRLAELAEPDEAARDADRLRRLLDGDAEDGVDVELGTNAPADLCNQPLALDGRPQRLVRARPPEGERRLARQALHESRARHP